MTVSEALLQIAELTKRNMSILEILNDSFYTKKSHLTTTIGDTTYTIPSYIALENKVNHLQDAFNNLVHSAECGEAWFNFDGNSRSIQTRNYQYAPNPLVLTPLTKFKTEANTMFKDMVSPRPYLDIDLTGLSDDITKVNVKKLVPYNKELIASLLAKVNQDDATTALGWNEVVASLESKQDGSSYKTGEDYLEYETVYNLPVRTCTKSGNYVIEKVLETKINDDLEEVIKVRISEHTPLTTIGFDGIMVEDLVAGDILITYDGSAKVVIETIRPAARELTLRVMSGEYVNPISAGEVKLQAGQDILSLVSDYSKLRYFAQPNDKRTLHIPLEEDIYVYIAVAPLNPRLNTQAAWGTGMFVNSDKLSTTINGEDVPFRTYYNENVQNIGDTFAELTNIVFPAISKYSQDEFNQMLEAPQLDNETLQVFQINKHLNDSETVKNIRNLYSQKKQAQIDLNEVISQITSLQSDLSQISFDDTSGVRSAYENQLSDLRSQQNTLDSTILKLTDMIQRAAVDSTIPIENGKYRIRGYVDVEKFVERFADWNLTEGTKDQSVVRQSNMRTMLGNIIGTQTRYRYRTPDVPQANIQTINEFVFTEWNLYNPPVRERSMNYKDGGYVVSFNDIKDDELIESDNRNKFNQIDIPITQGEVVELQTRIIYGFGYPFVTVATEWSDVVEVEFPDEFQTDVQMTSILEENNDDIEANRFSNILKEKGITTHTSDSIQDQDIVYFHKPENISSGFYTDERRIIPLSDKLKEINDEIVVIQDTLAGTTSETLQVSIDVDNVSTDLNPDVTNNITLPAFSLVKEVSKNIPTGTTYRKNGVAYMTGIISLTNPTSHSLKLFSMFPGSRTMDIQDLKYTKFDKGDFGYPIEGSSDNPSATPDPGAEKANSPSISKTPVAPVPNIVTMAATVGGSTNGGVMDNIDGDLMQTGNGKTSGAISDEHGYWTGNPDEKYGGSGSGGAGKNELTDLRFEQEEYGPIKACEKLSIKAFANPSSYNNYAGLLVTAYSDGANGIIQRPIPPEDNTYIPIIFSAMEGGTYTVTIESTGSINGPTNGISASCLVHVTPKDVYTPPTPQPSISVDKQAISLKVDGNPIQINANVDNCDYSKLKADEMPYTWEVYDSFDSKGVPSNKIVSVSEYGVVTPNETEPGTGILRCSVTYNNSIYVDVPFKVEKPATIATPEQPACGCDNVQKYEGIMLVTPSGIKDDEVNPLVHPQSGNQIITYRTSNPYDGSRFEQKFDNFAETHDTETGERIGSSAGNLYVYPLTPNRFSMCMDTDATVAAITLAPGQTIQFPLGIEYSLSEESPNSNFKLGFNVRNSLYSDPLYYEINLVAKYAESTADLLNASKRSLRTLSTYKTTIR